MKHLASDKQELINALSLTISLGVAEYRNQKSNTLLFGRADQGALSRERIGARPHL